KLAQTGMGSGPVHVTVRPEKVRIAGANQPGIPARVTARIFQGGHWLYHADALGRQVTIILQNDGGVPPEEGAEVSIGWQAGDMRVRGGAARS
ncbi:MAG: TOBE domain-containing protein, partial [Proteobacteria bacterium]|nr:TOBE domain-containing protein [Pseudomonadota bacterium]